MRRIAVALAVAAAGCRAGGEEPPPPQLVDPAAYEHPHTSELDTHLLRDMAKTIEWQKIGPELGDTYLGGTVAVDRVLRDDAANFYGVRVRLANRKNEPLPIQWRVEFVSAQEETRVGFTVLGPDDEGWRGAVLDPLGTAAVTDTCRVKGAVGFRLFVRAPGSNDAGLPDGFRSGAPEGLERLKRYR